MWGYSKGSPTGGAGTEVPGPWVIHRLGPAAIWVGAGRPRPGFGTPGHPSRPRWVGWDLWPAWHYFSGGPRTLIRCTPPRVDIVRVVQPGQTKKEQQKRAATFCRTSVQIKRLVEHLKFLFN